MGSSARQTGSLLRSLEHCSVSGTPVFSTDPPDPHIPNSEDAGIVVIGDDGMVAAAYSDVKGGSRPNGRRPMAPQTSGGN